MSPTVLEADGFKFFFYSREPSGASLEKPHVHVRKGGAEAKVWLHDCGVGYAHGFNPRELRSIRALVQKNREMLRQAWNEYFREPPSDVR